MSKANKAGIQFQIAWIPCLRLPNPPVGGGGQEARNVLKLCKLNKV